jgi:hypothetical protein
MVALGRRIRPSDQAQRGDGHLAIKRPFVLLVDAALQLDGAQQLTAVECDLAHRILYRTEGGECRAEIGVIGQEDGDGALDLHMLTMPHQAGSHKTCVRVTICAASSHFMSPSLCDSSASSLGWRLALSAVHQHDSSLGRSSEATTHDDCIPKSS